MTVVPQVRVLLLLSNGVCQAMLQEPGWRVPAVAFICHPDEVEFEVQLTVTWTPLLVEHEGKPEGGKPAGRVPPNSFATKQVLKPPGEGEEVCPANTTEGVGQGVEVPAMRHGTPG